MGPLATGEPVWDLQFDEQGHLTAPAQDGFLADVDGQAVEDLFMFSHGWGTATDSAQALYGAMFPMIRDAAPGVSLADRPGPAWVGYGTTRGTVTPTPTG